MTTDASLTFRRASRPRFTLSHEGEPHLRNRVTLLARHPEIATLFGYDRRIVAVTAVAVSAQLAIAAGLSHLHHHHAGFGAACVSAAIAWSVGAVLAHWGGVVIHEAAHNLCARTPVVNRWIALFANVSIPVPSAMSFRRHHLAHHRYLGVPALDNDLPTRFEIERLGQTRIGKLAWLCLYPLFGTLARGYLRKPTRWETAGFVLQMAVNAVVVIAFGWSAMAYLLLSTYFAYGPHPIAGHFVHEHYLWSPTQETYSYYGPFNRVAWNMGYHNEHHDFPGVPGSRLPELHAMAAEHYTALGADRSWGRVLWHFLTDAQVGHHTRFARTLDVFLAATEREKNRRAALSAASQKHA